MCRLGVTKKNEAVMKIFFCFIVELASNLVVAYKCWLSLILMRRKKGNIFSCAVSIRPKNGSNLDPFRLMQYPNLLVPIGCTHSSDPEKDPFIQFGFTFNLWLELYIAYYVHQ